MKHFSQQGKCAGYLSISSTSTLFNGTIDREKAKVHGRKYTCLHGINVLYFIAPQGWKETALLM